MHHGMPHQNMQGRLRACMSRASFRKLAPCTVRSYSPRSRSKRTYATASATKEKEVQESSNGARRFAPNAELMSWAEISERAGSDVLQGYQILDHSAATGQPKTASTRVLPTDEATTTDKPVLFYRDTNAWCPFCERV